jgi:hypothetical protein
MVSGRKVPDEATSLFLFNGSSGREVPDEATFFFFSMIVRERSS